MRLARQRRAERLERENDGDRDHAVVAHQRLKMMRELAKVLHQRLQRQVRSMPGAENMAPDDVRHAGLVAGMTAEKSCLQWRIDPVGFWP